MQFKSGSSVSAAPDHTDPRQVPYITIEHATKRYATSSGSVLALDDLSLDVREGEFVCILGPSGCGKSTLLWAMSGLHPLSSGEIRLGEHAVTGPNPEIGMVFQDPNLLPWKTLWENILFPFEIRKESPAPHMDRIRDLLEEVGLAGFEDRMPRELSGGMQQRASIVRCLGYDPSVILMDEPFSALDAFTRDEMNLLLQRLFMETEKTIVFVTHNISEALFLADRVAVLSPRPGRLANVVDVELPRPRNIDQTYSPAFSEQVLEVKHMIERGHAAGNGGT